MVFSSLMLLAVIVALVLYLPIAGVIILGALKMRKLQSYGLAVTAAILAMLPCSPFWLIGLPMGIWALVVLSRRDVKTAFGRAAQMRGHAHGHWADRPVPFRRAGLGFDLQGPERGGKGVSQPQNSGPESATDLSPPPPPYSGPRFFCATAFKRFWTSWPR